MRKNALNPSEYGGAEVAKKQLKAFPDIKTIHLNLSSQDALKKALEAVQALKNYFDERKRIPGMDIRENGYVFVTYEHAGKGRKGTKIGDRTFLKHFRELGEQLGFSNGGFLIKSRSHALRKFFASTLENAGMPKNKIDFMLGHTPNGNDFAYFKTDIESLKQLYIKYIPFLTFEREISIRSLDTKDAERLEKLEDENKKLKLEIQKQDSLKNNVETMKQEMDKRDETIEMMKEEMTKIQEFLELGGIKLLKARKKDI